MKKEILEKVLSANKNLIVDGEILSGKTSNVLLPIVGEKIKNKESLIILDSKEEYLNKYSKELKDNGYNVLILNFRDLDKSEGWNPLEYPYVLYKSGNTDKAIEYLDKIARVMFYENSSADPFWAMTASDFFTGVALGLFEDAKLDEINFNSINAMFDGVNNRFGASDYITEYFRTKNPASKAYISASTTFLAPKDTKGSILSVARQKLRLYVSREKLSHLLSKTTFKYSDCMTGPTAIFLIGRDESKYINTIPVMFIEQFFQVLLDNKSTDKYNIILDNIDTIDNIMNFSDMMGSGIARNIKFYIATRSIEALNAQYGVYINKLSTVIRIKSNKLEIEQSNEKEEVDKEFTDVKIPDSEIDYPTLAINPIKVFNLETFVKDKKQDMLQGMMTNGGTLPSIDPFVPSSNVNIDELIKNIDTKIAELDAEENMDKAKNDKTEVVSELSEFKVED